MTITDMPQRVAFSNFADGDPLSFALLVTPEVIPFITDEVGLIEFMQARGADYVVFFPDWSDAYRRMAGDPRLSRSTPPTLNGPWTRVAPI